jgi:hypothetical protein
MRRGTSAPARPDRRHGLIEGGPEILASAHLAPGVTVMTPDSHLETVAHNPSDLQTQHLAP